MDLTVKNRLGFPSLFSDLMTPGPLLGRDLWDFEPNLGIKRLGLTMPTANIKETPKEFQVELAAPGLRKKDFSIEIHNHTLTISAEKEHEDVKEDEDYCQKEYSFNSFCRTFTLPENIKDDKVKAEYEQGILKVIIPKDKETKIKPTLKVEVD